ncbi:MAG: pyruvate kinase [Thermoplasmatota archaeon]
MDLSRKTKIVCTMGPATDRDGVLRSLIEEGMDVARLNFSHGDNEAHRRTFRNIREISSETAILCDIRGPKIRTGAMVRPVRLNAGDTVRVTPEPVLGTEKIFTIDHPGLLSDLDEGDEIYLNDGIVKLRVTDRGDDHLVCTVRSGGIVSDRKGCNIPGAKLSIKIPTPDDKDDLEVIAELDPEYVAVSFVAAPEDIESVRSFLKECGNEDIRLIAKIERPSALKNLQGIIDVSDGIMVARGDLGVEIPPHEVPIWQKEMCRLCNKAGIPVIVATQMLESMVEHSRPTRAEASDVFNAVLDGADAVMLSSETSIGKHPMKALEFMKNIVRAAEGELPDRDPDYYDSDTRCVVETIGHACFTLVKEFNDRGYPGKVLAVTDTGHSARMISKYRPNRSILAITPNRRTAREMALVWGAAPLFSDGIDKDDLEQRIMSSVKAVLDMGLVSPEEKVVVVSSSTILGDDGMITGVYDVDKVQSAYRRN